MIKERVKLLKDLDKKKRNQYRQKVKGQTVRALVLGNGELLTENYLTLPAKGNEKKGSIVRVTL